MYNYRDDTRNTFALPDCMWAGRSTFEKVYSGQMFANKNMILEYLKICTKSFFKHFLISFRVSFLSVVVYAVINLDFQIAIVISVKIVHSLMCSAYQVLHGVAISNDSF